MLQEMCMFLMQISYRIRKITPAGVVSTFAGNGTSSYSDGPAATAGFSLLEGLTVDAAGNVYVADKGSHRIRKITVTAGGVADVVSTVAGSGSSGSNNGAENEAQFNQPSGVAVDCSRKYFCCG